MRNDGQKPRVGVPKTGRSSNGFIPNSFRAISSYFRIVSSGASTVASTVRTAGATVASSILDRDDEANQNQVQWAGFDKLELEGDITRQVLLLGYHSGFQVWDVEEAHNVHELASRYDGPVSFLQMQQKPVATKISEDVFGDVRPLLVVAGGGLSSSSGGNVQDGLSHPCNGSLPNCHEPGLGSGNCLPTIVRFYSLISHSYVHVLKFRSAVFSVRCSPRVVAISQATQIHCFNTVTLEREYTILTHPVVSGVYGSGNIGCGPLAVGPRWLAYSGNPVIVSNTGRVSPQHLTPSASFSGSPSNGNLVAHYAKESSKQFAAGIVILGDMGYRKLSRYCSELLPECNNSLRPGVAGGKSNGTIKSHITDPDTTGMVIVRDIVSKSVIAQFRAHKSPISALCFDPSGTLLVTASIQGHNINVFRIMPSFVGSSSGSDFSNSYAHLYKLQRGFTNAVIQDISFSDDSRWIMVSSTRGTSHLFAISPSGGLVDLQSVDASFTGINSVSSATNGLISPCSQGAGLQKLNQQSLCASGPPVTLSVVSRIKNGNSGWRGTVSGAAAAATGRISSLSGAIASSFHNSKCDNTYVDVNSLRTKYHLLVFSPSGCVIQYVFYLSKASDSGAIVNGTTAAYESAPDCDAKLVVEALQKWDMSHRQNQREQGDNVDIYGEHKTGDSHKKFPGGLVAGTAMKPKTNAEERHHMYISEAELQTHHSSYPLWAKSQVYFQLMMMEGIKAEDQSFLGGETEIERTPIRTIEARSKDLVPVVNYLQAYQFQQARRSPAWDNNRNRWLMHQQSSLSEEGRLLSKNSYNSFDATFEGGGVAAEVQSGIAENGWGSLEVSAESIEGNVDYSDSPYKKKAQLEYVNNKESPDMETNLKLVNNNEECLMTENLLRDANS